MISSQNKSAASWYKHAYYVRKQHEIKARTEKQKSITSNAMQTIQKLYKQRKYQEKKESKQNKTK